MSTLIESYLLHTIECKKKSLKMFMECDAVIIWHHTPWIYMWKDMNKTCNWKWDYGHILPSICSVVPDFSVMSMYSLRKMKWNFFFQDSRTWKCWSKGSHDQPFPLKARTEGDFQVFRYVSLTLLGNHTIVKVQIMPSS